MLELEQTDKTKYVFKDKEHEKLWNELLEVRELQKESIPSARSHFQIAHFSNSSDIANKVIGDKNNHVAYHNAGMVKDTTKIPMVCGYCENHFDGYWGAYKIDLPENKYCPNCVPDPLAEKLSKEVAQNALKAVGSSKILLNYTGRYSWCVSRCEICDSDSFENFQNLLSMPTEGCKYCRPVTSTFCQVYCLNYKNQCEKRGFTEKRMETRLGDLRNGMYNANPKDLFWEYSFFTNSPMKAYLLERDIIDNLDLAEISVRECFLDGYTEIYKRSKINNHKVHLLAKKHGLQMTNDWSVLQALQNINNVRF